MKMNLSKEWLNKRAKRDDMAEVSAGFFNLGMLGGNVGASRETSSRLSPERESSRLAFGKLINLCRRKKGLRIDELADRASIDLVELVEIEKCLDFIPEARTVFQLAQVLGLSNERLLQLSGNAVVREDQSLGQEAVRFAASSESVEKLNKNEQRALEEFVKFLGER
jgi:HTH-type transcriptional regulator, competence development regulator